MNQPSWTDVGQFWLAFLTFVVTTIGLALIVWQVRQAAKAQQFEANNATANSINELNQLLLGDPELLQINGETREEVLCHLKLNRFEQLFVLHEDGLMHQLAWESTHVWVQAALRNPVMQRVWPGCRSTYRADFAKWIDLLLTSPTK